MNCYHFVGCVAILDTTWEAHIPTRNSINKFTSMRKDSVVVYSFISFCVCLEYIMTNTNSWRKS